MSVEDLTEATRTRIEKKIESLADGDLEHAAETVSALWGVAKRDGDLKAPLSTLSPVSLGPHFTDERSFHLVRSLVLTVRPTGTLLRLRLSDPSVQESSLTGSVGPDTPNLGAC